MFTVEAVGVPELLVLVEGVTPQDSQLLGGLKVAVEGELKESVDLAFTVDPASLNLPPGTSPEDANFTVAKPDTFEGTRFFNVVDKATYSDGKVRTASPPFEGVIPPPVVSAGVPFMIFHVPKSVAVITGNVLIVPEGTPATQYAGAGRSNMSGKVPMIFKWWKVRSCRQAGRI